MDPKHDNDKDSLGGVYLESGDCDQSVVLINQIWERARITPTIGGGQPPQGILLDRNESSTDEEQIRQWLIHERRLEFGFERHRFNDLWGSDIAQEVFNDMG